MRKLALVAVLGLAGCGGGSGTLNGGVGGSGTSPGGVWTGTLTVAGSSASLTGLVDETGAGFFVDGNGNIYRGSGSMSGNVYSGSYQVYSNSAGTLTATVTATVAERASLNISSSNSAGQSGSGTATYDAVYNLTPSFASIAGTYQYSDGGIQTVVTINSNGSLVATDTSGCTTTGNLTIPDAMYNAYRLAGTVSCPGASAAITGMGYYRPASGSTPATLIAEYDNGSNAAVAVTAAKQ